MTDVRNVVLVHGGFVDGSGWRGVYDAADGRRLQRQRRAEPDALARRATSTTTRSVLDAAGRPGDPRRPLLRRRGHHRGGHATSNVAGLVYIAAFAPDAGESVQHADRRPAARRAGAADPAAAGRLPVPRPRQVRGSRSPATCPADDAAFMADSQVPWGVEALGGDDHRAGVAQQAELVPGRDRRPDDPAARAARHGRAGRRDRRRGGRQPLDLRLAAAGDRRPDQAGRPRRGAVARSQPSSTTRLPGRQGLGVLPASAAASLP